MPHKKSQGHYCWVCDRVRAHEKFSGSGHSRHICKDCNKLGSEELLYRQHIRNIDRCRGFGGGIQRKQRIAFGRFLTHIDPRVRDYALQIKQEMDRQRDTWNADIDKHDHDLHECVLTDDDMIFMDLPDRR
jgi:hypothetical protein